MQENILCVVFYLYKQQEKRLCLLNTKAVHAIVVDKRFVIWT